MVVSTTNFKTKKYYKMKRILLVIFYFALITKAIGQTADRIELDKIYQHISRTAIPTGYLNDYGSAVLNKVRYNGLLTDSNFIPNMNVFRLTLNDLLSAKINPSAPKNSITKAEFTVAQKPNQGLAGKCAVYHFPVAFFGSFFSTKKRTDNIHNLIN